MILLRVHAGPHPRRRCPVAVDLEIAPNQPVILYQEPGQRPRACQWESRASGSRLWWICSRLKASEVQTYRLVPVTRRKKPRVRLRWEALGRDQLQVTLEGRPVAVYDSNPAQSWPGLGPIYSPDGMPAVSRLWLASANAEPPHRSTRAQIVPPLVEGPVFARLRSRGHWLGPQGEKILEEVVTYTLYTTPADVRLLDLAVSLRASMGPMVWRSGLPGGLLTLELAPEFIGTPDFTFTNSVGVGGGEVSGRPAFWCQAGNRQAELAVFDHPDNPGNPCTWHVDEERRTVTTNPWRSFLRHPRFGPEQPWTLATGEVVTFRYRFYLHNVGRRPGVMRHRYLDYAFPPQVEVCKA